METNALLLLLALMLPLCGCVIPALLGRRLRTGIGWVALLFPLASTLCLALLASRIEWPSRQVFEWAWVPSLGLNLSLVVDGLSIFFGLIVSVVGCLIVLYANFYFDANERHLGRFYSYLVLFMAAMLGTVFADHLVLLFIFWELTSIASFLLIGFYHEKPESRVGARQALLVTGLTGLALFAGVILIQQVAGTARISELLANGTTSGSGSLWSAAMLLVMLGAFGKSAQVPLHFWLPNAMAAPTPVSAYLHSATMVKLGVFLTARMFPIFSGHPDWAPLVASVAFTTMLLGAVLAFLSHELKAILAFSTVSQLGYLIGYFGLGPVGGVEYDSLHILSHVLYKGSLFMIAGIVIHATGIYDIRQLGGLFRRMPVLGAACVVAAATMAGFPGTIGFISKEMMLKEILQSISSHTALGWYAAGCVIVASIVKVAFSARFVTHLFCGQEPAAVSTHFHPPAFWMKVPPLLLCSLALLLGLFPGLMDQPARALTVPGLNRAPDHFTLWHGFTPELAISAAIVFAGLLVFFVLGRSGWQSLTIPQFLRVDEWFEKFVEGFNRFAKTLTRSLRSDSPVDYLPVIVTFLVGVAGAAFLLLRQPLFALWPDEPLSINPLRSLTAALIALAVLGVVLLRRWTTQLISLSVAGFLTCFYFVLHRAPDLALTQILVETITLLMVLLLLARFPRSAQTGEEQLKAPVLRRAAHAVLAVGVGTLATAMILLFTARPHPEPIGHGFLARTVDLAEGTNAVNTILVDFRGLDTLGEIAVLLIAALGCLGLLMRYKRTREEYQQGAHGPPGFGVRNVNPNPS